MLFRVSAVLSAFVFVVALSLSLFVSPVSSSVLAKTDTPTVTRTLVPSVTPIPSVTPVPPVPPVPPIPLGNGSIYFSILLLLVGFTANHKTNTAAIALAVVSPYIRTNSDMYIVTAAYLVSILYMNFSKK